MKQRRIIIAVAALAAVVLAWLWLRPQATTAGNAPAPVAVDVATDDERDGLTDRSAVPEHVQTGQVLWIEAQLDAPTDD